MKTEYVQNNFLAGVLDPRAAARVETDSYNNGLITGRNIVPVHLGGVRRRPGLKYTGRLPNKITRIASGITPTAPHGGTAANANDNNTATLLTTTDAVSTTDPYVVVQYDLGSSQTLKFVDVLGLLSDGGSSTQFAIQYSADSVSWTTLGSTLETVDTTTRNYRRGTTTLAGTFTARYLRLAKIGGTDMGSVHITLNGMNVYTESSTVSEVRLIPFEVSTDEQYVVALTDFNMSVFRDGAYVVSTPSPYASADLALIDAASNAETMILVHENYAPQSLLREDTTNFQEETVVFESLPQYDFNDSTSPTPVSDVQVITFASGWVQGDTLQLELDGARTGSIVYAGDATAAEQNATAANIARQVQKLYTVPGFTGVTCARTGVRTYTVTFAAASADAYGLMSGVALSSSAAITVAKSATGTPRTEDVWSATRGYPRTVTFFEGRLWFGGVRSLQQSLFGSEVNNILAFEGSQGLADEPIFVTLTGAQLNAINGLFGGRSFQVFTSGGEFRFVKQQGQPIVPGDAPVLQTQYGAKRIRPVTIDGATLFIQRTGKAVRDFRYNYEEDAFDSLGVSSLAPHLIDDAVDLAAWNGSRQDEIGLVFVVNTDGTIAALNSRKEAQIQAWVQWDTDGLFKAVACVFEDRYFAIKRTLNGVDQVLLEMADDDYYTDCAFQTTDFTVVDETNATAGGGDLSPLNGEEVRIRANGFVMDNATVTAGEVAIATDMTLTLVEVGLDWTPEVTPMPLNTITPTGPNFLKKRRIVKVRGKVRSTSGLLVNGRVISDRSFDIDSFDSDAQTYSGNFSIEETTGWDEREDKLVTFSQVDPLPFELLGIEVQMESQP